MTGIFLVLLVLIHMPYMSFLNEFSVVYVCVQVIGKMSKEHIEGHIFTLSEGSSTLGKLWYFNL